MHVKYRIPRIASLAGLILLAVVAAACLPAAGAAPSDAAVSGLRPIAVEHVMVEIGVGSPIPVEAVVSGTWPDLCAQLAEAKQTISGTHIDIRLLATAADPECPPDYLGVPFRIAVPLNVVELPAGIYTVAVNGVDATLDWRPGSTAPTVPVMNPAQVVSVNVEVEGSLAVKSVRVIVTGNLPDTCSQLGEISLTRQGTSFTIVVLTTDIATGQPCEEASIPFELAIPLNLTHLQAGTYDVNVNGVTASFDPSAPPSQGAGTRGSING